MAGIHAHPQLITQLSVCVCVAIKKQFSECRRDQKETDKDTLCPMRRDVKSMMCRAIMESHFCLICAAKNSRQLAARLRSRASPHPVRARTTSQAAVTRGRRENAEVREKRRLLTEGKKKVVGPRSLKPAGGALDCNAGVSYVVF